MPSPHQHPAIARDQREDVAWSDDIIAGLGSIDGDRDGARAVAS